MIESATGLILRIRPLTETSLIVHWLTPTLGRLATVAKGARRPKSPFRGRLDLFFLADFSFSRSRSSELHALREVSVQDTHSFLRQNLGYLQQAAYCVGLVELGTETETPLSSIFDLLACFLRALSAQPPQPHLILAFELKFLADLGLQPDFSGSGLSDSSKKMAAALQHADWPSIAALPLSLPHQAELRRFLHRFLAFNLGKIPKGRDAALELDTGQR